MRVIRATRFGGPEVLVPSEAPEPVAGPGQVVVEVSAAGVLFVETQIRRGQLHGYFDVEPPYVPGDDVAGLVIAVGEGVDSGWIGRLVVARRSVSGGYAEQALYPVENVVEVPGGMELPQAAALMPDAITALALMDAAEIKPDEWVLITASAGGLGSLLVQLAHAAGARVIGAARGKAKLDLSRELGADVAIDYTDPDWLEQVREVTGGHGADMVFDGVGGQLGTAAFKVTADGGGFSAHGAPGGGFAEIDPAEAERRGVTLRGIAHVQLALEDASRLAVRALAEAAAGRLRPVIGRTYPLEKAADAHTAIEARDFIGKLLLLP
jgi:NADPH2:quinone reductase